MAYCGLFLLTELGRLILASLLFAFYIMHIKFLLSIVTTLPTQSSGKVSINSSVYNFLTAAKCVIFLLILLFYCHRNICPYKKRVQRTHFPS